MLIQNTASMVLAPQPARLASDGAAVAASPPSTEAIPDTPADLSRTDMARVPESNPAPQPSAEQLKNVVEGINKMLKQANRSLEFSVDKDTNRQVVKLVDSETGDVIRQFPSDEMLAISRAIDQVQQGLLLKQQA
jgi:flagellar protein FlaG